MLKVIEPMNDLFRKVVDHRTYHVATPSSRYDDDVAHDLYRVNKTGVVMKDWTFPGIDPMSVIVFLLRFISACNAYGTHERAGLWPLKQHLKRPTKATVKSRVALPNYVNSGHEGSQRTDPDVVGFLLKGYETDEDISTLENYVQNLK